ncbi:4a-hydroxytetrahydrobiopterin dehydratase [Kineosphaera limosa]|nr:4a-hydroxytetrahydrobiopterin dehydratase [Kineosphaera limosa]NYD99172.1 4a-hydroxytetrahydrobiopterin dehydratase [Kineosphaera limosa]
MSDDNQSVTSESVGKAGLSNWAVSDSGLSVTYDCGGFTGGGQFVAAVAALADRRNHHPDLSLSYPGHVTVVTLSHDVGKLTDRDLGLATAIERLAGEDGYSAVTD